MRNRTKKFTAWFFLIVFGIETFYPGMAYALTSGPAQPELTKFEPAGTDDMVDLFTGDFKYNIPLVDVGGYPINLSYHSGDGMEDEASWVGFGWTLNPGTINRDMRGLPDDFNGDRVIKTYNRKPFKKIGAQVVLKPTILAWEIGKNQGGASIKLGVYKDNYYGVGASFGLSISNRLASNLKTAGTAGLDFTSDNREGATFSPSLSLSREHDEMEDVDARSISGSFSYNTRAGLKSVDLGATFSTTKTKRKGLNLEFSGVKYYGQSYTPSFNTNTSNTGFTLSFDLGPSLFGGYLGAGGSGYYYSEEIKQKKVAAAAYGYMNYLNGRKLTNALIDFNREKEGVYVPGTAAIPIPVPTNDFFTATGQAGSLQFRPYFNGNYVVFDKAHYNNTSNDKLGITVGVGNLHKSGGRIDLSSGSAGTGKWVSNNDFLEVGEPGFSVVDNPNEEAVNFKQTGELTRVNDAYLTKIDGENTDQVVINDKGHMFSKAKTWKRFKTRSGTMSSDLAPLKKDVRDRRTNIISYLNGAQAQQFGLDKNVKGLNRTSNNRAHHLSEITVTDNGGKRMVYGIPVYNKKQYDVTFSVLNPKGAEQVRAVKSGLIEYKPGIDNSTGNSQGRDNLFTKDEMPEYATSFLLTGVLSPDYVDVKNDGITNDDLGTAYKFSYAKIQNDFKWRAPYAYKTANYNQGFNSDLKDDKASYVYGEKELWYLDTVESKTMVAVFITSDREDGLGVLNDNGGKNDAIRLKKLDKIELYSKADCVKHEKDPQYKPIPIKVVHFEYDYSTHPGVPNNTGAVVNIGSINVNEKKGKLTLKRIYFTFGNNKRGQSNPYEFSYEQRKVSDVLPAINQPLSSIPVDPLSNSNPEAENTYTTRQTDRWGTYKPSWYNHLTGNSTADGKLENSEFPYAIQDNENGSADYDERKLAGLFASMWQLNKIVTPAGSTINIEYEADDYGFVQDRRAMQMCFVKGVGNTPGTITGMRESGGFTVELPRQTSAGDFKRDYLEGPDGKALTSIYYKIHTDLDNWGHKEYVQGYAEIEPGGCYLIDNKTAFIALKKLSGKSPVTRAAWQMLKTDLPQYAYDNYDNSDVKLTTAAIKSLLQAVANMREYFQSYEKTAYNRGFGNKIDLTKSMIRLYNPDQKKLGGGERVKRLTIEDAWHDMSHNTAAKTAKYGQLYKYEIIKDNGKKISSGVAAYEPQIGNEENPFHEPIPYTEKVHWAPDKYHFVEKPYCETFFPAASVGYSKVTVTNFGDGEETSDNPANHTGYIEYEFYTAKDFPTLVDNMPLESREYENGLIVKLFTSTSIKRVATSQGFKIELNDMHGKPKSVKVFDKGGNELSSTETFYSVDDDDAEVKHLKNDVEVVKEGDGAKIVTALMGVDVDLATDMRQSTNESMGAGLGVYNGAMVLVFGIYYWYWPYFAVNTGFNLTADSYHSVSTVKVIHRYGIVKKIRTIKNGSSIEAENMLWDGETGNVLLTRTQNEFNDYNYSFNYPAYWAEGHEGMDAAYKNIGAVLTNMDTQPTGVIPTNYYQVVFPGDELISGNQKFWVLQSDPQTRRLIDVNGNIVSAVGTYSIYRSGRRNLTGASVGSIVCMNNPVVGAGANKKLQFNVGNKILDAKAVLYSNEWSVPVPDKQVPVQKTLTATPSNLFTVGNVSGLACTNVSFEASSVFTTEISAKRSYMNFPAASSLPANATITSAQLELTPIPDKTAGPNSSWLRRVTESVNCSSNKNWTNLPAVTSINEVVIPSMLSSAGAVSLDVTAMFSDWYALKDAADFGVSLQLRIEGTSQLVPIRSMAFYPSGHLSPRLFLTYQVPECTSPISLTLNPYVNGVLGNWRPKQSFVYMVDREQKAGLTTLPGGTNIRTNGAYTTFNPFWEFRSLGTIYSNVQVEPSLASERWIWANKTIYFDQKGNEVESASPINRDRQGNIDLSNSNRYSAALYGYRESMAIAIANNARHNEIAFDGFEDYNFSLQSVYSEPCPPKRHFDWGLTNSGSGWCYSNSCLSDAKAHSGKYSIKLTNYGAISVSNSAGDATPPSSILSYNANGQAVLQANELAKGFAPVPGKKYLLSMWVHDGNDEVNKLNTLNVSINYQDQNVSAKIVPVVEGWKLLDIPFTAGSNFDLQLSTSGGDIYIDDVRIFPYDANMSSFVYDDITMRLLAQLDENNFATFYEYDDEGTPIRVKKETERGIMTLKENRQSFRQR